MRRKNAASPRSGDDDRGPKPGDEDWMRKAVALARRGLGATYPNPSVGAVVVRDGVVVGTGRTAPTGGPHAEARALQAAGDLARGSTLYVTLEPCSHHGRTPPCTAAILHAGVARVVFGVVDDAPHASGAALALLRDAGVDAQLASDADAARCAAVHEHYLHHTRTKRPFVTLKTAASLDGRVAVSSGDSKWITSPAARKVGHRLRAEHHAIAVGIGTALADNPGLDVRLVRGQDPLRVVFDSRLRLANHRDLALCGEGTWVLHTDRASASAAQKLQDCGVRPLRVQARADGRISIRAALRKLGAADVRSLLVEGGGSLVGAFVDASAWHRWYWFSAPRILGEGTSAVAGATYATVARAPAIAVESRRMVGPDALCVLRPRRDGP